MNEALKLENVDSAIFNVYSPPRVNAIAEMWKLLPGWSLDLTSVDPEDGRPWDFSKQDKRDKAERMVKDKSGELAPEWMKTILMQMLERSIKFFVCHSVTPGSAHKD